HREVRDPDIIVTVYNNSPWPGQSAAHERRAGIFAAVRPQERHAASVRTAALLRHGPYEVLVVVGDPHDLLKLFQGGLSPLGAAEPVRDPDVALAVHVETASAITGLERVNVARVGGGETGDEVASGIRDPNPALMVESSVKRTQKCFAGFHIARFAD